MIAAQDPSRTADSDTQAPDAATDGPPSADERKALLKRAVARLTREERARVRSQGEFDALVVRGKLVNNRLHLAVLVVLAALSVATAVVLRAGLGGLSVAVAAPCLYALFWLFLATTGGEELEHVSVDEQGRLSTVKSGRLRETRGNVVRVAVPAVVAVVAAWVTVGLIHDIAYPPAPRCDFPPKYQPERCMIVPNAAAINLYTFPLKLPSSGQSEAPVEALAVAEDSKWSSALGSVSVEGTILLERGIRTFQLAIALSILLPSVWFLRRMLTGKWVAAIRPVSHRGE
jgi:hypothetical protein